MATRTLFESVEGRSVGIPHERSLFATLPYVGRHMRGLPRNGISTRGGSLPCHRSESWSRTWETKSARLVSVSPRAFVKDLSVKLDSYEDSCSDGGA